VSAVVAATSSAMSAVELRDWLTAAAPALVERGIVGTHGTAPRIASEGSTWISFSSPWGSGRLVRALDGSSRSRADRYHERFPAVDDHAATTTEGQLDALVGAIGRPATQP
jgi:hypothetical protein